MPTAAVESAPQGSLPNLPIIVTTRSLPDKFDRPWAVISARPIRRAAEDRRAAQRSQGELHGDSSWGCILHFEGGAGLFMIRGGDFESGGALLAESWRR